MRVKAFLCLCDSAARGAQLSNLFCQEESKMKRLISATLGLLALAPQYAMAFDFTVPMDTPRRVFYRLSINEDCSSMGEDVVRITAQPQHGAATVKKGKDHPSFPQTNPRNVCNVRTVPSTQLWYKPDRGYVGPDSISVDIIDASGRSSQQTISIQVR
jgi:hypothetical protein